MTKEMVHDVEPGEPATSRKHNSTKKSKNREHADRELSWAAELINDRGVKGFKNRDGRSDASHRESQKEYSAKKSREIWQKPYSLGVRHEGKAKASDDDLR